MQLFCKILSGMAESVDPDQVAVLSESVLYVVMLALWSPSLIAAHFAFCFTSCIAILAFWSPSIAAHFAFCFTSCD